MCVHERHIFSSFLACIFHCRKRGTFLQLCVMSQDTDIDKHHTKHKAFNDNCLSSVCHVMTRHRGGGGLWGGRGVKTNFVL